MNVMAFIPARGGSKGIPNKNLALLGGRPMIQYTIEAAQKSKQIDRIFLSSDDPNIISFCESLGVKTPYRRPEELARDETPMMDTVIDALKWLEATEGCLPENIILLQPTSPLRRAEDIDNALRQFIESKTDTLVSVHEMKEHPYECVKITGRTWSYLAKPDKKSFRRQDYQQNYYFINGAIYLAQTKVLIEKRSFIVRERTQFYNMPGYYGIDVDEYSDLKLCEFYLTNEHSK